LGSYCKKQKLDSLSDKHENKNSKNTSELYPT